MFPVSRFKSRFRIKTPGYLWTPAQLSPALWLDAADANTITLNGSTVSQWNDKSGNGRNATQTTATNQPTYSATGINSKPSLNFDGSNDFMDVGISSTVVNASASVFGVIRITTLQTSYNAVLAWSVGFGSVCPGVGTFGTSGSFGLYGTFGSGAGNLFDIGPTSANTNYLFNLSWANNGLNVNGGLNGANAVSTRNVSFTATVNAMLGRDATSYSSARFGEIVVCQNLTTDLRQQVEGYLAWKWGLEANLPAGHPYRNYPPTV